MTETTPPIFRMVCRGEAIAGLAAGWAAATLRDGEVALLIDDGDLAGIDGAARALDQPTVTVLRRESDPSRREQAVITYAGTLPLIWVAGKFSPEAGEWARERGPMTLLIGAEGTLPEAERTRVARFVTLLARQTD